MYVFISSGVDIVQLRIPHGFAPPPLLLQVRAEPNRMGPIYPATGSTQRKSTMSPARTDAHTNRHTLVMLAFNPFVLQSILSVHLKCLSSSLE